MKTRLVGLLAAASLLASPVAAQKRPLVVGSNGQAAQIQDGTPLQAPTSTTAGASINVPQGTPPTSPANGDVWMTAGGLSFRSDGTTTTLGQGLGSVVYAKDGGVKCNGAVDDTAKLNAVLTANVGKRIILPAGDCFYAGGGVLGNSTVMEGAGRNATRLLVSAAAPSQLLTVSGYGAGVKGLNITASTPQTGGSWVLLSGTESWLSDFSIVGDYNGIRMTGVGARVSNGRLLNGAAGSTRILSDGGDTSQIIDNVLIGADSPIQSFAGIRVRYNAALVISNSSVIGQGVGMLVDPPSGQWVSGVYVHDSFFDNNQNQNLKINPTGTGSVTRLRFSSSWFGSSHSTDGILISNGGSGALDGVHFLDPQIVLNVGAGLSTSGTVTDIAVLGGTIGGNAHGLYFNSGASKITITGASIGAYGGVPGNTGSGVVALSGVSSLNLIGNQMVGNAIAFSDATGNVTKNVTGNIGLNPYSATVTVGASPYTFTNTLGVPLNMYINGGTVSSITAESNTVATSTDKVITLSPGKSMVTTYSSVPVIKYSSIQ